MAMSTGKIEIEQKTAQDLMSTAESLLNYEKYDSRARKTENCDRARQICEMAIAFDSTNPAGHHLRGLTLLSLERYKEALGAFEEAIRLDPLSPNSAIAHFNRACALSRLGRNQENLNNREEALGFHTKSLEACNQSIALGFDTAKVLQFNQKVLRTLLGYQDDLDSLGRHQELLTFCNQSIESNETNAEAHYHRACALSCLGRNQERLNNPKVLRFKQDVLRALFGHKKDLISSGRLEQFLDLWEQNIALNKTDPIVHYGWGIDLGRLKLFEKALFAYSKAIELNQNYPEAHYGLGFTLYRLGQNHQSKGSSTDALNFYQKSLAACNKSIELGYNENSVHHCKAKVLISLREISPLVPVSPEFAHTQEPAPKKPRNSQ